MLTAGPAMMGAPPQGAYNVPPQMYGAPPQPGFMPGYGM